MRKPDPKPVSDKVLGRTGNGYLWTHDQIIEIAGLIALRDLCLPGEAVRALYSLMGEGRLPLYSEALRNARRPSMIEVAPSDVRDGGGGLRGHGPANIRARERAAERALVQAQEQAVLDRLATAEPTDKD